MKKVLFEESVNRINNNEKLNIIYNKAFIEKELPIKKISEIALKEGNAKKPVYEIHKWWARRLSIVVRALIIGALLPENTTEEEFWKRFYSKNFSDLTILDCFMGGGTSLVEAKKLGAKTIGIDIDPLACFITKKELEECKVEEVIKEFEDLKQRVGNEIKSYYLTKVDGRDCDIINAFWVYEVKCDKCNNKFQTHPHYKINYNDKEQIVFCKNCGEIETIGPDDKTFICSACETKTDIENGTYSRGYCICPNCGDKFRITEKVEGKKDLKLFAIEYEKSNKRYYKKADKDDIKLYRDISEISIDELENYYIPDKIISVDNRKDKRPVSYGYNNYKNLFNDRQLLSLAKLYSEIGKISDEVLREWFIIAFSDCLAANNLLCNYAYGYKKLTPLFGIHAYTVPVRPVENNVWGSGTFGRGTFEKTVKKLIRSKKYCEKPYECELTSEGTVKKVFTGEHISSNVTNKPREFYNGICDSLIINSNSEDLSKIKNSTVDIILTDPPYYDNLHYSELADFYYQWIKESIYSNETNALNNSLYVNGIDEEYHEKYLKRLKTIFKECYKKMKDNGIMIFSYHHNKKEAWEAMAYAIKSSNFTVTNVLPIRSEGQSAYHSGDKSIKWDSILVLRKKSMVINEKNADLETMVNDWSYKIKNLELGLKECDLISFSRSLGVMYYCNSKENLELDLILESVDELVKNYEIKM